MRGNKEVMDNMIEDNRKAALRMETQLDQISDKIGDKILTTVGGEIANLARIMTQFMLNKDERPARLKQATEQQSTEEEDERTEQI